LAFTDPQTLTINAVANPLPRTASGNSAGSFTRNDGTVKLAVSSAYGKRTRRTARVDFSKIAPDPLIASTNIKFSMSAYVVVDVPVTGFSIEEQKYIVDALTKWLTDTSGANTTKLLGGEN
jgi:hypothetical protein